MKKVQEKEKELNLLISDIYKKLDYISSQIDHNEQLWLDFQDKLNKYSVQE